MCGITESQDAKRMAWQAYWINTGELDTGPAVLLWSTRYYAQVGIQGCYGAIRVPGHSCRPKSAAPTSPSPQVVLHRMMRLMHCKATRTWLLVRMSGSVLRFPAPGA